MKASIPENGTVIRLEGENAIVFIKGAESCKGCGAAQMGLCKGGMSLLTLTVRNTLCARTGDTVKVGFEQGIQTRGYLLIYILPLFALIAGAFGGYIIGKHLGIKQLDVILAFISLALSLFYSFKRLKKLDSHSRMVIEKIVSRDVSDGEVFSDEDRKYFDYTGNHKNYEMVKLQ
ncbi:MAG: SoxR reducing system RseC family protein [Nitrospirae bacterium]|nr:SoxR reducing system RseC family protein [Nitrospirota bacterium]